MTTAILTRLLRGLIGLGLFGAGALYGTLGVWGVDRGGNGAWLLVLIGLLGIGIGVMLLGRAINPRRRPGR